MTVWENIFAKLTAETITRIKGEPGQDDIDQLSRAEASHMGGQNKDYRKHC